MRRRTFIAGLGSAAAWPVVARGQQRSGLPVIGFLGPGLPEEWRPVITAFRQGLLESGLAEGENVAIEYRWAENKYDRLPTLASDLVRRKIAVIAAIGNTPAAVAAKAASGSTPVIFAVGADPVRYGLVESLNRPGAKATGVIFLTSLLVEKQFELLHEMLPRAEAYAVLVNPTNSYAEEESRDLRRVAFALGRKIMVLDAGTDSEIEAAYLAMTDKGVIALQIPGDAFFYTRREKIVALGRQHAIPTIYAQREFVEIGGLMSYGASLGEAARIAGGYVAKVLRGEKPENLPVQQSTKVELALNLKAAKVLGLEIPARILARADEVIE